MTHHAVRRQYSALASSYDRTWARYVRDSTTLALAEFPTAPALRILDIGCGTGVLLRRALDADATRTAIGVDITLKMLRQASQELPATVPLVCASSDTVPFRSASVDLNSALTQPGVRITHDDFRTIKRVGALRADPLTVSASRSAHRTP